MTQYRGKWALVTGASAGIGEAFANTLAQHGSNLILVARREDRLLSLAERLQQQHSIKALVIVADLSQPDAPEKIMQQLEADGIPIDILINNAGFGLPGEYLDNEWQTYRDYIELMVTSYAALTRHALPGMKERGYGRIIHVSSIAGLIPGARGHTLYGACKAFLVSFAQSLAAENAPYGIYTSALCPGLTLTEFHDVNGTRSLLSSLPGFMIMPVEPVIEGAIRAVEKQHIVYVPGLVNKFLVWLSDALPRSWSQKILMSNSSRIRRNNQR